MENGQVVNNSNKKFGFIPIIIILALIGACLYLFLNKTECKECEKCQDCTKEVEMDISIIDKIGNMFYWLGENKIEDMNSLDNNLKFCIAIKSIGKDVYDSYGPVGYSKGAINNSLMKIFGSDVIMQHKKIDMNQKSYGLDCFISYNYNDDSKEYTLIPGGSEGPVPTVNKKVVKIVEQDQYYEVYIKAIYEDVSDLSDSQIYSKINQGQTYKLTFKKSDQGSIWTKYEIVK